MSEFSGWFSSFFCCFFARLSSFSRGKVSKISLQSPRNGDATPYGNSNTIQFDFFKIHNVQINDTAKNTLMHSPLYLIINLFYDENAFHFLQIKKPRTSSYIRLVLLPSGQTVYKVDALSQNVTIGSNSTTLHFAIPHPVLSMDGLYAILIDKGVVVGQGCSSGGTPTPRISSSNAWRFYVDGVCSSGYSLRSPDFQSCVGTQNFRFSEFLKTEP